MHNKGYSSLLARISTPVTRYTPRFIRNAEWYRGHIPSCLLDASSHAPSLYLLSEKLAGAEIPFSNPVFLHVGAGMLLTSVTAPGRESRGQGQRSASTTAVIMGQQCAARTHAHLHPSPHHAVAERYPRLGKKQQESPGNKTSAAPLHL